MSAAAAALAGVLLVIAAGVWLVLLRDSRGDVWAETTHPLDPGCVETDDCGTLVELPAGHYRLDEAPPVQLRYDPDIDTPIAQWGDCLDAFFACLETEVETGASASGRAGAARACMAAAERCPAACRERFVERTADADFAAVEAVFFEDFVDEGGWCVPREADR